MDDGGSDNALKQAQELAKKKREREAEKHKEEELLVIKQLEEEAARFELLNPLEKLDMYHRQEWRGNVKAGSKLPPPKPAPKGGKGDGGSKIVKKKAGKK